MNKKVKKAVIFFSLIVSIFLSYCLVYFLAEKYFFDKIFYLKSYTHGYPHADFFEKNFLHSLFFKGNEKKISSRNRDLTFLLSQEVTSNRYDSEYTNDKFKIALIGDSFIYGLGVKERERASNILEKKLNRVRPSIVYNFGNLGDSLVDNYIKYNLAKEYMDIDLFIFGLVEDDLNFLNNAYYLEFEETLIQLSQGCKELKIFHRDPQLEQLTNSNEIAFKKDEEIRSFYSMVLDEKYGNICLAQKIANSFNADETLILDLNYLDPMLMCLKNWPRSETDYKFNILINEYLRIFSKANIKIIDGYNRVASLFQDPVVKMQVSEVEGHPSKFAHYWYAQILFDELTTNDKWGFIEN